jgi:hypothetical protein
MKKKECSKTSYWRVKEVDVKSLDKFGVEIEQTMEVRQPKNRKNSGKSSENDSDY